MSFRDEQQQKNAGSYMEDPARQIAFLGRLAHFKIPEPAWGPCNRSKGNKWPTVEEEALGFRFLNPTVERDYGIHLFEDPESHKIVGLTPAGRYHLRRLALNTEHLVLKRKNRSIAKGLRAQVELLQAFSPYTAAQLDDFLGNAESAIPEIDPPLPSP